MIVIDVIYTDEASDYGMVEDDVANLGEENESGFVEVGVSTGVTEPGTKEVEVVQQDVKYASLL